MLAVLRLPGVRRSRMYQRERGVCGVMPSTSIEVVWPVRSLCSAFSFGSSLVSMLDTWKKKR